MEKLLQQRVNPDCADNDGDYICSQNDCDDNDANAGLKLVPGSACDDGNPETENDVYQEDGCTCAGTPISTNPCDNINLSLDENNPGLIYVNGRNSQIQLLTLYDSRWNKIWDGTCDKGDPLSTYNAFGPHPPGLYRVYVWSLLSGKAAILLVNHSCCSIS